MTRRAQDLLLIALALVAAVAIYFAFATVRSAPAPERTGGEVNVTTSTPEGGSEPADSESTTEPVSDRTSEEADSATVTETAEAEPQGNPLEAAREALSSSGDEVTVAVLGDSTSNERSEWVHLWAERLSAERPVTISHWDEADGSAYNEPDVLSEGGDGAAVTIWSGSQAGATAEFPVDRLEEMVPEEPDFVMLNFGHNNSVENVGDQLSELQSALREQFGELPMIAILQNPQISDRNADVRDAVAAWAEENGAATIDVASEFYTAQWPLLVDDLHPSLEGQQIWADTVADALG